VGTWIDVTALSWLADKKFGTIGDPGVEDVATIDPLPSRGR
jgi:hypothetical protein